MRLTDIRTAQKEMIDHPVNIDLRQQLWPTRLACQPHVQRQRELLPNRMFHETFMLNFVPKSSYHKED